MPGVVRNSSLMADFRRMGPVIGIVLGTALVSAVSIQWIAVSHLAAATAAHPDACNIAEMNRVIADGLMPEIRSEALELLKGEPLPDAFGRFRDDPRLARVISELTRAVELCPFREQYHERLATAHWYAGNEAMTHFHLGRRALLLREPAHAVVQFNLARAADPSADAPLYFAALAARESGDQAGAERIVRDHMARFQSAPDGLLVAGRVLARSANTTEAAQLLQAGIRQKPTDIDAIRDLTELAIRVGRLQETADFLISLDALPVRTIPTTFANAAVLYRRAGNLAGEEDALRRALRLFPNSASLHYELAVVLSKTNRRSEARDTLRRAMELSRPITMQLIRDTGVDPSL